MTIYIQCIKLTWLYAATEAAWICLREYLCSSIKFGEIDVLYVFPYVNVVIAGGWDGFIWDRVTYPLHQLDLTAWTLVEMIVMTNSSQTNMFKGVFRFQFSVFTFAQGEFHVCSSHHDSYFIVFSLLVMPWLFCFRRLVDGNNRCSRMQQQFWCRDCNNWWQYCTWFASMQRYFWPW